MKKRNLRALFWILGLRILNWYQIKSKRKLCLVRLKILLKKNIRNTFIIFFQITQHLSKRSSSSNSQENKSESKKDKKIKNEKPIDVRCFECHGFGHMTHECANTLKKKMGKAMQAIWDDSDVEVSYD